jgi:uncharacterized protein YigE (DUF2233 family)
MKRAAAALALAAFLALDSTALADSRAIPPPVPACRAVVFEDVPLTDCTADPAHDRIRIVVGPEGGQPYRTLAAFAASRPRNASPVRFAMNAGMFGEDGRPIGYTVIDGKRVHRLNRADAAGNFYLKPNGVFFGTGGSWQVLSTHAFADNVHKRPGFATQSGPMLVIDGQLHPQIAPDGPSRKIRNGVGVDAAGRAHFVISEAPISFGKFARYYRDVIKAPNALFLDGTVSQLWNPASKRMDSGRPLGPLVVVERAATRHGR